MGDLVPFFQETTVSTDSKALEFGIESDCENGNSIPDEELYDAVNDETFGGDVFTITTNEDDLEQFSAITGDLSLFDDAGSIQLPDPSQIPIPRLFTEQENDDQVETNGSSHSMSSIWATGSFNGIHSLAKNYPGTLGTECQNGSREEQRNLEQMLLTGFSSINQQFAEHSSPSAEANYTNRPSKTIGERQQTDLPKIPMPTSSTQGKTLSVEELERRMLMEVSAANTVKEHHVVPSSTVNSFPTTHFLPQLADHQNFLSSLLALQKSVHGGMPSVDSPTSHLPPQQQLMQLNQLMQCYQMAMASCTAKGLPPPPFPPLPFFNPLAMAPPIAALTPQTSLPQDGRASAKSCFISQIPLPRTPSAVPFPTHPKPTPYPNCHRPHTSTTSTMPQLSMVPSSLHPQAERYRRQRMSGLPSEKTICDFALDPYAGFMSTKEREWLIKIHIIQCLGSGDPVEDDYYYTMWKQRNVLQKAPDQWRSRENPKYYKFEATFPSTGYTAPSFLGSLGKPIHSTTSQPRQIIEVNSDNTEDASVKNRQKRLRAVLIKIENGALALLDCRSIQRKLRFFEETCITQYLDQNEITGRTARFDDNLAQVDIALFSPESLPTIMLIQKGRLVIYDWLKFWGEEKDFQNVVSHTHRILSTIPKFAKKMPEVATMKQFSNVVCHSFASFPLHSLVELLQHTAKWESPLICESKLVQLILLSLIRALIDRPEWNIRLNTLQNTGAAYFLHSMPISSLKLDPERDIDLFKLTHWAQLRQWLIREQLQDVVSGVPSLALSHSSGPKMTLIQWIVGNQTFVLV